VVTILTITTTISPIPLILILIPLPSFYEGSAEGSAEKRRDGEGDEYFYEEDE
jgi:hypothetical protein